MFFLYFQVHSFFCSEIWSIENKNLNVQFEVFAFTFEFFFLNFQCIRFSEWCDGISNCVTNNEDEQDCLNYKNHHGNYLTQQ